MKDKSVEGHGTCEIRHQQPPLPPSPPNEDTRSPSPSPPQTASALLPTATPRSLSPSPLLEPSNTSSASATATATASKGELLRRLSRGTTMIKFPNKLARRPEERRVRLVGLQNLDDNMLDPSDTLDAASSASAESNLGAVVGVGWESKKRKEANFHAIREIRLGQNTKAFELHGKNPDVEERAFSIIYVAEGKYKMLNLVAPSKEECALWVAGLHMLLANMSVIVDTPATPLMSNPIPESMHSWLHRMWNDADPSQSGKLGLDSVTALMGRLNVRLSKLEVKSALKNSGITKHSFLVFEDFERLYRTLRFRPEIGELFSSLAKIDPSGLTYEEFEHFMIHTQKNKDISRSRCLDIYKKYLGTSHPSNRSSSDTQTHILSLMDMDHFSAFLLSANNPVFRKSNATSVYHDMTRPLTDYIINSSHNTYLLGDQLAGECSVEGYIRALQRGCRCIELDCFDGPNGQPSIYHKNSLTNRILFRDVVDVISRYAFVASSYPLILSLETHCSVEQQAVMARILVEVLGDALVCEPISSSGKSHRLPSPAELMGRILVKGKVKPMSPDFVRMMSSDEIDDESEDDVTSSGINSSISSATGSPGRSVFYSTAEVTPLQLDDPSTHPPPPVFDPVRRIGSEESFVRRVSSALSLSMSNSVGTAAMAVSSDAVGGPMKRVGLKKIASVNGRMAERAAIKKRYIVEKSLMDLVVYCKAVRFTGIEMLESMKYDEMVSITETKFLSLLSKPHPSSSTPSSPTLRSPLSGSPPLSRRSTFQSLAHTPPTPESLLWINHHSTHLSRIYPAPFRISSSNLENPCLFWSTGVQMVAMNYQTFDRGLQVNSAMFRGNGGCGYLVKSVLREWKWRVVDGEWRFFGGLEGEEGRVMTLQVRVISGQQLPGTKDGGGAAGRLIHSPPWVEIEVVGSEADCMRYKTKPSSSGGFNAIWKEEFRFQVLDPGLAVLRFCVISSENRLTNEVIGRYSIALDNLELGYRHVPLLNRNGEVIPFSTLFLHLSMM